jgi:hypothetical protein
MRVVGAEMVQHPAAQAQAVAVQVSVSELLLLQLVKLSTSRLAAA